MLADERVIVHSEYGYILRDFQLRLSAGLQYIGCTRIERREHGGRLRKGGEPFGEIAFRGRYLCGPVLRGACAEKRLAARARPLAVVWVRHEAVGGEASERVEELRGGPSDEGVVVADVDVCDVFLLRVRTVDGDDGDSCLAYRFGEGLLYDEMRNTVSVDTADRIEAGNQRPVTSNAVYVEVGNIEALLKTL